LLFEEGMCFRTLVVAQEHDSRAIELPTEVLEVPAKHRAVPLALPALFDDDIFNECIRLVLMHRVQAEGQKRGPVNRVARIKNKEKIVRISAYFVDSVSSHIYLKCPERPDAPTDDRDQKSRTRP
jgi:hypothetical protein